MTEYMNIKEFESEIDPVIAERGLDYYQSNAVIDIYEEAEGHWMAEVDGSKDYTVKVSLRDDIVENWNCDCPYEHGPICKHVVAVLHYLRNDIEETAYTDLTEDVVAKVVGVPPANSKPRTVRNTVDYILSKLSDRDLRNFVAAQLNTNNALRNDFLIAFAHIDDTVAADVKYHQIIEGIAKKVRGRNGFIDYYHTDELVDPILELVNKAELLVEQGDVKEAFSIVTAVMELTPEIAMEMDDSDGGITNIWESAMEVVYEIIHAASPSFKESLFNYYEEQFSIEKYGNIGMENDFLELLSLLANSKEQEKRFFDIIDQQLKEAKRNERQYEQESLLTTKINYLEERERHDEALAVVYANLALPKFRMKLIKQFIADKRLDEARKLCIDGIAIAEKERYAWATVSSYTKKLLEIAQEKQDIPEVLALAEELFRQQNFEITYFKLLKKHWPVDGWEAKREALIDKVKGPNEAGTLHGANTLAEIFIEEGLGDRLLKLLQLNQGKIRFIDQFAEHVAKDFPKEVVAIYQQAIVKQAEPTGRSVYNETVHYLEKLSKLNGGKQAADNLVKQFRLMYKNRRAMMEILNEHFK